MVIEYRLFYSLSVNSLVANSLVANFPYVSRATLASCNQKHNYFRHQYKIITAALIIRIKAIKE